MKLCCPNCGYPLAQFDVKPSDPPEVQDAPKMPDLAGSLREAVSPVFPPLPDDVKVGEANVAEQSGSDILTTVDKVQIQELHRQGFALARIRQKIGKKVTLAQIRSAAKLDKRKHR